MIKVGGQCTLHWSRMFDWEISFLSLLVIFSQLSFREKNEFSCFYFEGKSSQNFDRTSTFRTESSSPLKIASFIDTFVMITIFKSVWFKKKDISRFSHLIQAWLPCQWQQYTLKKRSLTSRVTMNDMSHIRKLRPSATFAFNNVL